jgi:peptidoglycan hydrolase-like protein with peptidoglycan-binding domain
LGFRRLVQATVLAALTFAILVSPAAASTHKSHSSKSHGSSHSSRSSKHRRGRKHGQQAIDASRAREIQTALIRERYLSGQPTGAWDSRTKEAMARYQADNGWQTKKIPDSRAIIKLGLGPSHADLLNPNTAAIAPVEPVKGGGNVPER